MQAFRRSSISPTLSSSMIKERTPLEVGARGTIKDPASYFGRTRSRLKRSKSRLSSWSLGSKGSKSSKGSRAPGGPFRPPPLNHNSEYNGSASRHSPSKRTTPTAGNNKRGVNWTPRSITPAKLHNHCFPCCEGPDSTPDEKFFFVVQPQGTSSSCTLGTKPSDGIWFNTVDRTGLIMSTLVWFLTIYATLVIIFLGKTEGIPQMFSTIFVILACLSLACHAKTSLSDPGSVPIDAEPLNPIAVGLAPCCSRCKSYKPPFSHHCRICNRCVSRMDHHCPWMNNCVGAANLKFFILFLIYEWVCNAYALTLLGYNYFLCATEECTFTFVLLQFTRIMTCLSVVFFLFTSSMLMNVIYGLLSGIGTIDRMKKKVMKTMNISDEPPILLMDVWGIGPWWHWPLPIDPIFSDVGHVMQWRIKQPR